ncbi:MAG TPA: glycosyltransferase family 4 protein [bacterium]|jgi:phosphatidylinositol alpha-1,6-mannosyltransferase|nr:glycosyltransferase family 4 protein [bacterium]HNZ51480.1 glycosyltransferase family 4 protein [bacterium]HOF79440.1 glycosyltransferase family 4 protein [bacterium]HOH85289.1 glycosyltransferase family 4 protein [bacterium]HOQ91900.1 glycosyltransferase family 4 protein [bacterium]
MRYLLVTLEYPPFHGGIAHYYSHLAAAWPRNDEFIVLDNNHNQLQAARGFWPWRRSFQAIWQAIKQQRIDYVLVGQILPLGTVVWLLSYFLPIKYGIFLHGMDWGQAMKRPRKRWLVSRIIARASSVIAANSYVAGLVKQAWPSITNRLIIINPGLSQTTSPTISDTYRQQLRQQYGLVDQKILLTVGRLVERKGVDQVLRALPELINKYPNLYYLVVGQGPYLATCQQLASDLAVNSRVIFITDADDQQRAAWYQLADIFIMPARQLAGDFEGFGIVYLEANQAGKPVIAGRSGGVADAVVDGLNGLMVDPNSSYEIIAAVSRLLDDSAFSQQLGQAGQARLAAFLWPTLAAKLAQFINKH